MYLVIAAGFAPSSFLLAKFTFCRGYQLISLVFTLSVHVPPFFSCFSSKFCVIAEGNVICTAVYSLFSVCCHTDSHHLTQVPFCADITVISVFHRQCRNSMLDGIFVAGVTGYLPVQRGLLDEHIHRVQQKVGLSPVSSERVDHGALDQT